MQAHEKNEDEPNSSSLTLNSAEFAGSYDDDGPVLNTDGDLFASPAALSRAVMANSKATSAKGSFSFPLSIP